MLQFNRKKMILLLIYSSFFIAIPIIKNETRLIEKKIQYHKAQITHLEKNSKSLINKQSYLKSYI